MPTEVKIVSRLTPLSGITRFLFCALMLAPLMLALSQNPKEFIESLPTQEVDTSYVNLDQGRFSIRTFIVFKNQSFRLLNNDYGLKYAPNNRFGVGVGFAYYPLLLDFALNLKLVKENASTRMDFQGQLLAKKTLFSAHLQNYNGFNVSGSNMPESLFRPDISSYAVGASALRILNANKISLRSVLSGGAEQKRSMGSFAMGGGINFNGLKADSSIIPSSQQAYFNEQAGITKTFGFTATIQAGYVGVLVLPHGFFAYGSVTPGIGLSIKKINSSETYFPKNPLSMEIDFQFSLGYNDSKIYSTIGWVNQVSGSSLDFGNRIRGNTGRLKWVVGFKL